MKEKVLEAFGKLNIKLEQTDETCCSFKHNGHTLSYVYGNDNEGIIRIDAIPQVQTFIANIMEKLSESNGIADTRALIGGGDSVVIDEDTTRSINGHDYVDLGLSVKWATCNVGAGSPSDYGNFFAWGETSTKLHYGDDDIYTSGLLYKKDRDITYLDVACQRWGKFWRLPTNEEIQELLVNCDWVWSQQDGHSGYKVTSKKNGHYIFLPAAGQRCGSALRDAGEIGYYWTSTPLGRKAEAYSLYFCFQFQGIGTEECCYGSPVRPVSGCLTNEV